MWLLVLPLLALVAFAALVGLAMLGGLLATVWLLRILIWIVGTLVIAVRRYCFPPATSEQPPS